MFPITLTAMGQDREGRGWHSICAPARGNITIASTGISIEFDFLPLIDLWRENPADMTVNTTSLGPGDKVFVWNTTGSYGGFGPSWPSSLNTWESTLPWAAYYGNGLGEDGQRDRIGVSVYQVVGGVRHLLGNATAYVEVYKPLTEYRLLDANQETGWIGGGSNWWVAVEGHGLLSGYTIGFHARQGDVLTFYCQEPGYRLEWNNQDVYLWLGSTGVKLISGSDVAAGKHWSATISV